MEAARPLRWGIAGFGWVARDHAAPGMAAAGAELVAVCDPDPAARAAAGAAAGFASLDVMLRDGRLDALYVATPNHLHRDAVERAAEAGVAVLCEKPMAARLDDAEAMARAVRRAGIRYGTAYDQRHHPAHEAMRGMIAEGRLGTVTAIRIVYCCWLASGWSADNWRADRTRAGGGALLDLAPHGLDLVQFLLGERLVEVRALGQHRVQDYAVEDGAVLIARSATGALASLHVAYNHRETLPRRRLEVVGTEGMLVAENTMGQSPGGALTWLDEEGAARVVAVPHGDPFARQMAAFGRHLREGGDGFDLERDLHTERLVHQAMDQCL